VAKAIPENACKATCARSACRASCITGGLVCGGDQTGVDGIAGPMDLAARESGLSQQ
jgi:hypothetical protein